MTDRRVVHTTVTGQTPSDEGRDYVPTRDERWRPSSLDRPKSAGTLDRHITLSPAMLKRAKEMCADRGIRLSDCRFLEDGSIFVPNN